ncbi:MAG: ubiquinol-cytochrome C chaperone family protein [Magnetococcales bacterium]|nr:ubiquinol-cytochrome C chaperone family protein [Magnetococcales bacterium]
MSWLVDRSKKKRTDAEWRIRALAVHDRLVARALELAGGGRLEMEDGFDLRFDLVVLFVSRTLYALNNRGDQGRRLQQALWDALFEGLDHSLRQRGVNDIRMAPRMRRLFRDATGRRDAYLAAWRDGDDPAIRRAVGRNVLNGAAGDDPRVAVIIAEFEWADGLLTK